MMDPNNGFSMDMPSIQSMGMNQFGHGQQQNQQMHMGVPPSPDVGLKRHFAMDGDDMLLSPTKKQRTEVGLLNFGGNESSGPAHVPPSTAGIAFFGDMDVLSGRGGGTNVHPGNRNFRDLINLHRRAYLKARKNDKPAISRSIVRSIRETKGRFLKKDERTGLWFEIGDDAAREKTSQALRQRAPEMRRLLFDTEQEEARAADDHVRQQQQIIMGMNQSDNHGMTEQRLHSNSNSSGMYHQQGNARSSPHENEGQNSFNPALFAMANKAPTNNTTGSEYAHLFSAALLGGGINRFTPHGA